MIGNYTTTTGVQLYRWQQMGITDPKDLQWLLEFYHHVSLSVVLVQASLQEACRSIEE